MRRGWMVSRLWGLETCCDGNEMVACMIHFCNISVIFTGIAFARFFALLELFFPPLFRSWRTWKLMTAIAFIYELKTRILIIHE